MELDVGASVGLGGGLTWTNMLGYFIPGDAYKGGVANADLGNAWAFKSEMRLDF